MDRVYFDGNIAPNGKDWLHCEVMYIRDSFLCVYVREGYPLTETKIEFPLSRVQRIEYGKSLR